MSFTQTEALKLAGQVLQVHGLPYTVTSASTRGTVMVYDPTTNEYLCFDSRETFENWAHGTPISSAGRPER